MIDNPLTLHDLEHLCHLWEECRLSVAEEAELEYLLCRTPLDSALIRSTRSLMGLSHIIHFDEAPAPSAPRRKSRLLRLSAAAAIIIAGASALSNSLWPDFGENAGVAYVDGHKVSRSEAKAIAVADMQRIEKIQERINRVTNHDQCRLNHILNIQNQTE